MAASMDSLRVVKMAASKAASKDNCSVALKVTMSAGRSAALMAASWECLMAVKLVGAMEFLMVGKMAASTVMHLAGAMEPSLAVQSVAGKA